ncbi:MAG: hypothetical protein P8I38_11445 [Arenicella sp.]|nr:hypothetical protein [Arenicella sp.]HAU68478.1 hypothetical protein [Gammaproteobacteria bacterium]
MLKIFFILVAWCILFALSWPLAILVIVFTPLAWLITLPFLILAFVLRGAWALIKGILLAPAYLLGWRPNTI